MRGQVQPGPRRGVLALGVAVGVPADAAPDFANFTDYDAARDGPLEVILQQTDPIAVSGEFTTAVVDRTSLLTVHAGVVSIPRRGVLVIPAKSGAGKSTLTAALVQRGFGYMSDEVLAISRRGSAAHAFPRSITLDNRSLAVLGLPATCGPDTAEGVVSLTRLGSLGPSTGRIDAIVIPERRSGANPLIEVIPAHEAVAALIEHSFNHYRDPESSLRSFVAVVARANVFRATYEDATAMAERIASHLEITD